MNGALGHKHDQIFSLTLIHFLIWTSVNILPLSRAVVSQYTTYHYYDLIMGTIASQITSLTIVCSNVYSDADQRKHQSSESLAFVWGIQRDRWIPRTNGQLRGKCFRLMTSSCNPWFHVVCFVVVRLVFLPHSHDALSPFHYNDVIMSVMVSQITSLTIVYSTVYSGADQRKHQSSAPLAFVRIIYRWPVNSPHKWPVTRKMFPFDDVIMKWQLPNHNRM